MRTARDLGMGLSQFRRLPERDRVLAVALTSYEAQICTGCGHPMFESMDPANEGKYVSEPPMRCHACTANSIGMKAYEKADNPEALRFRVKLR